MTPNEIARSYIERGWNPVPIGFKEKRPKGEGWQKRSITLDNVDQFFKAAPQNIGVMLGATSGGLVDCDLDCPEAIAVAAYFMPETQAIFGRASKPASHRLYYSDLSETSGKATIPFKDPQAKTVLFELRAGGNGAQTVFPGSTHKDSGEPIEWDPGRNRDPSMVVGTDLEKAGKLMAAACLFARYWPAKGGRHEAGLVLGGMLARSGMDLSNMEAFAEAVAVGAGASIEHTVAQARDAAKAFESDHNCYGYPMLRETFDERVAEKIAEWLGYRQTKTFSESADDGRVTIEVETGEEEATVDKIQDALIASGRSLYQRGGEIVGVGYSRLRICGGDVETVPVVEPRGDYALTADISACAKMLRYDRRSKELVRTNVPMNLVKTLQQFGTRLRFPTLAGFVTAPILRPDGSILDKPGYDEATGLLFDPLGVEFPLIPEKPTKEDAQNALAVIDDLFREFKFVGEDGGRSSRAVALSAVLTACNRGSIKTAPMHGVSAPVAGSGKSLIVNIAAIIATGHGAVAIAPGPDEVELEKQLNSVLFEGASIISFDNAEVTLAGPFLNRALSETTLKPRRLGKSETPTIINNFLLLATGNNLTVARDMVRRTLLCRIDPGIERPELKNFERDLISLTKDRRPELLVAALTVLRAYHIAGRPKEKISALGNFEDWSNWIRGALIWLGCADPVRTMDAIREDDPAVGQLRAVLTEWESVFGPEEKSAANAIKTAIERKDPPGEELQAYYRHPELRQALLSVAGQNGQINPTQLGFWLKRNRDRVVGGLSFVRGRSSSGVAMWRVNGTFGPTSDGQLVQ